MWLEDEAFEPEPIQPEFVNEEPAQKRQRVEVNSVEHAERLALMASAGAPALAAEAEVEPPPTPWHPDDTDFSKYVEEEEIEDEGFCFDCLYAQSTQQYMLNLNVARMHKFHKENKPYMAPFEFVRKKQTMYNEDIRPHLLHDDGTPMLGGGPAWSARSIWDHDGVHTLNPDSERERTARTFGRVMRDMEHNGLHLKHSSGRVTHDSKWLKDYIEIWKQLKPLLEKLDASRNRSLVGQGTV